MNIKYDFSVVIPSHNVTENINSALDSIINQQYDFSKIEILIIDDGSTDNLKEWVQGYLSRYSNIKYYWIPYGKFGSVINYVIANKLASGKYITILEPTDRFVFYCFKTISQYFSDDTIDLFLSDVYIWRVNKKKSGKIKNHFKYQKIIFSKSKRLFIKRKNIEKTRTPWSMSLCKFYRNELFYLIDNLIEQTDFQDTVLFNDAIDKVHVVKYINKALGWWKNDFIFRNSKINWTEEECHEWLNIIYNLVNDNAIFVALLYIYYYKEFKQYLLRRNIKINLTQKVNMKWVPFGLRIVSKCYFLLADKKYIC